jgi:hypothetical protein
MRTAAGSHGRIGSSPIASRISERKRISSMA